METILNPLVHNALHDIGEIQILDSSDDSCLEELKLVLEKHSKIDKFGIALLHKHFNLAQDETLVETIDTENRVLTSRPEKISALQKQNYVQTLWCFSYNINLKKDCESFCPTDKNGNHHGYNDHY